MTPDCYQCGTAACIPERGHPWWTCPNDDCDIIAFIDEDAPPTEDPRTPQSGLTEFAGGEQT